MTADGSTSAQALQVTQRAGFWLRADLGALRVTGDDRLSWLNGQVTNDLRALDHASSVQALAIHVRGKIMAEVWVSAGADELLLVYPIAAQAELLESLERYIIMEDVTLEPCPEARVLSVLGPEATQLTAALVATHPGARGFSFDELGTGGYAVVATAEVLVQITDGLRAAGALEIDDRGYDLARLRAGVPRYGLDFGERSYPQEAGLKRLVSFSKGCYLGQEVVCTLENRGKLTRRLALLRGAADGGSEPALPASGSALKSSADEALGEVTSAVYDPDARAVLALGYVKRAQAALGTTLTANGAQFTLERIIGD